MRHWFQYGFTFAFVVGCLATRIEADDDLKLRSRAAFGTIESPDEKLITQPIVQLGQRLFWDERLSSNGQVSCASCHLIEDYGADARSRSLDAREELTPRNSPTVFNSLLQPSLRWLGDRKSGAAQATGSLKGSMGWNRPEDVLPTLAKLGYGEQFQKTFPVAQDPMTPENFGKAIEAYEQTLLTPAPFDKYLKGEGEALTSLQTEGLRLFLEVRCADCHSGRLLGGASIEKFGVMTDYWKITRSATIDEGVFKISGREEDKYCFRVPMLRNVARTAPYFHDGSVASLDEAIAVMGKTQLGMELSEEDIEKIRSFLETLTGEVPAHFKNPFQIPKD